MEESPQPGLHREECLDHEGNLDYHQILLSIQTALQEAYPDLSLDPSLQYRIAGNYAAALTEISGHLGKDLMPTMSDGAEGIAMTVDAGDHDIIVLDAAVIEALFTSGMITMIHLIHHELGHAHDNAIRRRGWARELQQERFSALRHRLFPLAEKLWSEYHAERRSAGSIRGQSLHAPILIDFMPIFLNEVAAYIVLYRFHADLPHLLDQVSTRVCLLLQIAGYVLGDLAGTGSDPATLHAGLPGLLDNQHLRELWLPLQEALDRLYQTQGSWESSEVFIPLEEILIQLFKDLGLELSERPEGLWVEVPHPKIGLS